MSSESVCAFDHHRWQQLGLLDYEKFSDCITERNMVDRGDYSNGTWYYASDKPLPDGSFAIYHGTWGNDNSPGASMYTHAELYDTEEEQKTALVGWNELPEWIDEGEDDTEDDEEEFDEDDEDTNEE